MERLSMALAYGADAVYLAGTSFGMRSFAGNFTPEELFEILCHCLGKFSVSFSDEAERHMLGYLRSMAASFQADARTMKLLARAIYQKVILRESEAGNVPEKHVVELADVELLKWDGKKGKIGF